MRRLTFTALFLLFATLPCVAFAGNNNSFFMGSDASLAAGATAPVVRDSEAIWYNPAGLGGNTLTRVNLSGNAFQLRLQTITNGIQTDLPSGTVKQDLKGDEYLTVPTAMTFMTSLSPNVSFGFGIYMPVYQDVTFNSNLTSVEQFPTLPDLTDYTQGFDVDTVHTQYNLGAAAGWQVNPKWRLGATLFVLYDRLRYNANIFEDIQSADGSLTTSLFYINDAHMLLKTVAVRGTLGTQIDLSDHYSMAIVAFAPTIQICTWGEWSTNIGGSGQDINGNIITNAARAYTNINEWNGDMIDPFHAEVSFALRQPDYWIALAGSVWAPMTNSTVFDIRKRVGWNVNLGSKFKITKKLNGGAGFFTDNSNDKEPNDFGETQVNYYGLTGGVEFKTPVSRHTDDPNSQPIIFSTTLAGRYALGLGKAGGLLFNAETDGDIGNAHVNVTNVTFHELSLYIGAGLFF